MTVPISNSGRDQILGNIRRALTVPAPKRHNTAAKSSFSHPLPIVSSDIRSWLPRVGNTWEEQAALFAENSQALRAEFYLCDDQEDMRERLSRMAVESGWKRFASHHSTLTDYAAAALPLPCMTTDGGYDQTGLELCDAALTSCDALIAQTGSVLVTCKSAGGRALSLLPPHHVVLATRSQLVPDLTAAFLLLQKQYSLDYPSMISLITGPSRTGDIERTLVLGAHGPKRLTIFCF